MADPTFYRSAQQAVAAPPERLAYVATLNTPGPDGEAGPDAIVVLDTDPRSPSYGTIVGRVDMTHTGDELHHFGWNACSACLCHVESNGHAGHDHGHESAERRYLVVPGLRSSRIYIIDTKPDPTRPTIVKTHAMTITVRVDVTGTVGRKLDALRAHASQLKDFDEIEKWTREWTAEVGKEIGIEAAEGFHMVVIDDDDESDEAKAVES